MSEVTSIRFFMEVARRQSFSGAADHFGVSPATVSKHVAALEKSLQVQLLSRTTKRMSLTQAGQLVLESGEQVLNQLEGMRNRLAAISQELSGEIRVGVAPSFGVSRMTALLMAFCERYPGITVTTKLLTHRKEENFVVEGLDVGVITATALKDAGHRALTIASMPQVLVASPAFMARHGRFETPADLVGVNCLVNETKSPTSLWHFDGPGGAVSQKVHGSLRSNFGEILLAAALGGLGVSMHPMYMVAEHLESQRLVKVMPHYRPETLQVFAIYRACQSVPQNVRAFLDYLREWLVIHPDWPAQGV